MITRVNPDNHPILCQAPGPSSNPCGAHTLQCLELTIDSQRLNVIMQTLRLRTSLKPFALLLVLNVVFSVNAQSTNSSPRLRPIQQNGKWGYIDSSGKIVIQPQFVWAEEFSEGLAAFENESGKHGY